MRPKVSVVGSGEVAEAVALGLEEAGGFDVVHCKPVNPVKTETNGNHGSPAATSGVVPGDTENSLVLVLVPESPEASEAAEFVSRNLASLMPFSPDPLIVVANSRSPRLCEVARSASGVSGQRVIGTGTQPDSRRLQLLIAGELGISALGVEALAVGEPGNGALPLVRFATASGVPVLDLIDSNRIGALLERFRESGEDASSRPDAQFPGFEAAAIERIVTAVGLGRVDLIPCTVMLRGEYGLSDVYMSVPAVLGSGGVLKVVELDLSMDELIPLRLQASGARSVTVHQARGGQSEL